GQPAGKRQHLVRELAPGPGLPDAEILLPNRGARATHARVVQQQLRECVQPSDVLSHRFLLLEPAILAQKEGLAEAAVNEAAPAAKLGRRPVAGTISIPLT